MGGIGLWMGQRKPVQPNRTPATSSISTSRDRRTAISGSAGRTGTLAQNFWPPEFWNVSTRWNRRIRTGGTFHLEVLTSRRTGTCRETGRGGSTNGSAEVGLYVLQTVEEPDRDAVLSAGQQVRQNLGVQGPEVLKKLWRLKTKNTKT